MINKNEYIERREKIYNTIDNNSVVILYAGASVKKSADESYPFEVNRNFYYLTGICEENSVFVAYKQHGVATEFLFIPEQNENIEKWVGKRLSVDDAREISGIDNVVTLNQFDSELDLILSRKRTGIEELDTLYLDLEPENLLDGFKTTKDVGQALILNYPWLKLKDIYKTIILKRMVKTSDEIVELKEAIN